MPPHVVARLDQGEAADASIVDALMASYRESCAASGHAAALVGVTAAALTVIGVGSGDRIAGALGVAVARLCEADE